MEPDRAGVGSAAHGLRSRSLVAVLAVIAAALVIHLFGPAIPGSTVAASPEHAHSGLELGVDHPAGAAVDSVAEAHREETCHAVLGITPAATAVPAMSCIAGPWRQDLPIASVRSTLRPAWIGGDGGNAPLDPRRSPGVQRT